MFSSPTTAITKGSRNQGTPSNFQPITTHILPEHVYLRKKDILFNVHIYVAIVERRTNRTDGQLDHIGKRQSKPTVDLGELRETSESPDVQKRVER